MGPIDNMLAAGFGDVDADFLKNMAVLLAAIVAGGYYASSWMKNIREAREKKEPLAVQQPVLVKLEEKFVTRAEFEAAHGLNRDSHSEIKQHLEKEISRVCGVISEDIREIRERLDGGDGLFREEAGRIASLEAKVDGLIREMHEWRTQLFQLLRDAPKPKHRETS